MNETSYKRNPLAIKVLGGGKTFLKVIFVNTPLLAVSFLTLLFCSCEKGYVPSLPSDEASLDVVELSRLLPGSRWQLASLVPADGDMEINVAWKGTTVEFTSDSAFFYRKYLAYDPISQTTSPETTLAKSCNFYINDGKITLDTTFFRVETADSAKISLASAHFTMPPTHAESQ